ncbi:hypothetical protein GCM10008910_47960 [Faecalicatena orotica]|uniref:Putative ABC transport system permease protein n=1 Tax=Faecalicatena orotica TaxID=1544 RepID=A0A2Y9BL47_9FIRM|nr:ABC transporter permease [Faecalicatena orotica]PWJ17992.1 putative ABC transport system permease protein [Faecalicatena orotica]SSA58758.1 putative ABC transport system permease protein [Faecalicatena orotica]
MKLIYKQLFKQVIKDKIFLSLLLLLTMLTSLSFFFVMGSIDGNIKILNSLQNLTANQQLYKSALNSNMILAYTFWLSLVSLSIVVFVMFFYRFFRTNKKQIGCIKTLGFKNSSLQFFFIAFTAVLSIWGAILGLLGGYVLSAILIRANTKTYDVTGLTKSISGFSLVIGLVVSTIIFCIVALLCYGFVRNKEAGSLLAGNSIQNRFPVTLKIADKISRIVPVHKRLSLRIALRKPLSILLLFVSVMSFNVCMILGQSLNISSAKIFNAQTTGHNYEYQIQYQEYKTTDMFSNVMMYIDSASTITINNYEIKCTVSGLYDINALYELQNKNNKLLTTPNAGYVYINPELSEIYGVKIGDILVVTIADEQHQFIVGEIAANAQTNHIYMNGEQLTEILDIPAGSYNGAFSADKLKGGTVTSKEQRIEELNRNSVSNKTSAVINQVTGVLVGIILIFLVLHISFQDNTHDILILSMLGHPTKYIRKLLIDVYLPVLWVVFVITLTPSILLARAIQNSLSVSTNDYMPFGINLFVLIIAFVLMNLIYYGVQAAFSLRIKKIIEKEEITDIIYAE